MKLAEAYSCAKLRRAQPSSSLSRTLGLERSASADEVRQAYKKLALKFHPDKNQGADTTAQFQAISAAYKRISDPKSNQEDDMMPSGFDDMDIPVEEMFQMFEMMFGMGRKKTKGGRRRRQPEFNFEDMFFADFDMDELNDEELAFMASMGGTDMFDDDDADLHDLASFMQSMSFMDMKMPRGVRGKKRGVRVGLPGTPPRCRPLSLHSSKGKRKVRIAPRTSKAPVPVPAAVVTPLAAEPPVVAVGQRVLVSGKLAGRVAFVGSVHYTKGDLVGVVLDAPVGKNNGTLKGHVYFECPPGHGLMVHPCEVTIVT
ncbi:hypothetical protein ACHHYP_00116 [Achlya hypogyna]|uniref:J domain-containing protein n=1 Tax=Achlya hypogyna TaxID=1202772 RepID=A0A1V9ZBE1_ACHHY|nr:hypothetical protein ACHHYP_00116 [Achlya hypogyna]